MIELVELVNEQKLTGMSDIEIIKKFFVLNDLEEEAIDLIGYLAKIKIEKENKSMIWQIPGSVAFIKILICKL